MATIKPDIENGPVLKVTWKNMQVGDVGAGVSYGAYKDRSMQVEGVDGTGGNVLIEGSNNGGDEGGNFRSLTVDGTTVLNMTAAKIKYVLERTGQIRPHVTTGDGETLYTVTLNASQ